MPINEKSLIKILNEFKNDLSLFQTKIIRYLCLFDSPGAKIIDEVTFKIDGVIGDLNRLLKYHLGENK